MSSPDDDDREPFSLLHLGSSASFHLDVIVLGPGESAAIAGGAREALFVLEHGDVQVECEGGREDFPVCQGDVRQLR